MGGYDSWGRISRRERKARPVLWGSDPLPAGSEPMLPYGLGRSYGDSCLNDEGVLLDTRHLDHVIRFDRAAGVLRCEAGVTLEKVLDLIVPQGWFLPVSPGTKFVTVGGAIANDIHGKNHHTAGTFGRHVEKLELLRSDGSRLECSASSNPGLFRATIGGLGLTGLITWAEFKLKKIDNPFIEMESIRFLSMDEFMKLSDESDKGYEYIVAWVDCTSNYRGERGVFMRGNHAPASVSKAAARRPSITIPFQSPDFLLNPLFMRIFSFLYRHKQLRKNVRKTVHYEPFFYPLDSLLEWNRLYGSRGFFQYQCVVPMDDGGKSASELLALAKASKMGSFLTVLKTFGAVPPAGILSFPRKGVTICLDVPNKGAASLELFEKLDAVVMRRGGAVYPAKDARMSREAFARYFPQYAEFKEYVDPGFSSNFIRRVTAS